MTRPPPMPPPPPQTAQAAPCPPCPPPPCPRYDWSLHVSQLLKPKDSTSWLYGQMFVHAPATEPFAISMRRLVAAIREDGRDDLSPTSVFVAYRRHPELGYPVGTPPSEIVRDPAPRSFPTPDFAEAATDRLDPLSETA